MQPDTDREGLRATLAAFDPRQQKIVGGVVAVMIENPERVRDREWMVEQYTHIVLFACDFEDVAGVQEGTERVQAYARDNIHPILNACYQLFQCVGDDLAPRVAEGITREEAVGHALGYFAPAPE
jgi:hypothetical protein